MQHIWQTYISPRGKLWDCLNGDRNQVILCVPTSKGFLWVYRSRFGYAASYDDARQWVEALAEAYDPAIPAGKRWIPPLGQL